MVGAEAGAGTDVRGDGRVSRIACGVRAARTTADDVAVVLEAPTSAGSIGPALSRPS